MILRKVKGISHTLFALVLLFGFSACSIDTAKDFIREQVRKHLFEDEDDDIAKTQD